jgi:hypothetical protein
MRAVAFSRLPHDPPGCRYCMHTRDEHRAEKHLWQSSSLVRDISLLCRLNMAKVQLKPYAPIASNL